MKTQIRKPSAGKSSYSEEYKQHALELWHAEKARRKRVRLYISTSRLKSVSKDPRGTCQTETRHVLIASRTPRTHEAKTQPVD